MEENIDLIVVQNPVTAGLEHQKELLDGLQNIDSSLAKNEEELKQKLNSLENAHVDIDVKRQWLVGVDIDSINKSLNNVYDNLREYVRTCGSAIRTTNENLSHTLGLIRILAMIEKDLYEQVDNETIQSNVLKDLIRDWCEKNNIREEEVNSLLESSFQRAYTLRDRINNIRSEIFKKFEYYDSEILELESNIESLKSFVSSEKTKTLKELSELYSSKESKLIKLSSEKTNELLRLHKENLQTIDKLKMSIESQKKAFDEKVKDSMECHNKALQEALLKMSSESQKKIEQFNVLCESIQKEQKLYKENIEKNKEIFSSQTEALLSSLKVQLDFALKEVHNASDESQKQIVTLHRQIVSENEDTHSKIKEMVDLFERELKSQLEVQKQEYDAMLNSQKTLFSETLEKAHTQAKQLVFYGTIAGVLMASALFYAITVMF